MRKLSQLLLLALCAPAFAADNQLVPNGAGQPYLKDISNRLWPATVVYTTDGFGSVVPISGGGGGGGGNVTQGGLGAGNVPWKFDFEQILGAAPSATNFLPFRLTDGTTFFNPATLATAANQSTANTSLSTIATNTGRIPAQGAAATAASTPVNIASDQTVPVSAASLPLPSGAATAANQATANTSLSSIDTKTPALVSGRQPVDGSGVTQPVSAASLPLPSGASTAAKQPALGTAGSASTDVITVQGITSMTALKTDGSAVTQPVSAASLPLPSGASTSANQTTGNTSLSSIDGKVPANLTVTATRLLVDPSGVTSPVSVASLPLPSGAATETSLAKLPVTQGSTTSGQSGPLSQAAVTTASPSYTTGQTSPLSVDTAGSLRVTLKAAGTTGSTTPTVADLMGGSDGTNMQAIKVSTGGNPLVAGDVASAASDSGNPVKVGAKYNGTAQAFTTGQRVDAQASADGSLLVASRFNFRRQATAATVTLKTGEGILHTVCLLTPVNGSTLEFWDNTAASGTIIANIAQVNGQSPNCFTFDAQFSTGLTFTTVGTADWTITYR